VIGMGIPDPGPLGGGAYTGPLLTDRAKVVSMHQFAAVDSHFNKMFGLTFKVRKCFKTVMGGLAIFLTLIGLAVGLPAIYKLVTKVEGKDALVKPVYGVLTLALIVLGLTGFLFGWPVSYPLNGFPLLTHVGFGALYAIALTVWALLRAKRDGNIWFWVTLISGLVLILSILVAMFPILGTHGQHLAIVVHRWAAGLSIIAAVMGCACAKKQND
jgi:hypothetical protein